MYTEKFTVFFFLVDFSSAFEYLAARVVENKNSGGTAIRDKRGVEEFRQKETIHTLSEAIACNN